MSRRALWCAVLSCSLGCGPEGAPVPVRTSPVMDPVGTLPPELVVLASASSHRGFGLGVPTTVVTEIRSADESVVVRPSMAVGSFDVAPDGLVVACASDGAVLVIDGAEVRTEPAALGGAGLRCTDVAAAGRGDAWMTLAPADGSRDGRICHLDGAWSCAPLARDPARGTLALTPEHAWWIGHATGFGMPAQLLVVDRAAPAAEPVVVVDGVSTEGTLAGSSRVEDVVFVPYRSSGDQDPVRFALDGARTALTARSERGAYVDVWRAEDGRVLALDVLVGARQSCTSGYAGVGGGCTWTFDWSQLVVLELGTGAPTELAHVDYEGGGQRSIGLEHPDGTRVSGDRLYALP